MVIARDTTHAGQLMQLIQRDDFFEGRYKDEVIQVESSKTGAEQDAMVERLLKVEHTDEPTEIVIHVNMLKEGWDVTNLYTIVPLRAANARILIEQSIGRGLRLPYGKRTGETAVDYEVVIKKNLMELKPTAYAQSEPISDFRVAPSDKSNMAKHLFGGFKRCLYPVQKFQSDAERVLAVILDRESDKWFKPAKGQFQIFYKSGADHPEYQPDFVAETEDAILMLEPKAKNQLEDIDVLAKKESAVKWCALATEHNLQNGGKPRKYALIPHDVIAENMTLVGLVGRFGG